MLQIGKQRISFLSILGPSISRAWLERRYYLKSVESLGAQVEAGFGCKLSITGNRGKYAI
jgi:hypothetical protein